MWHEWTNKNFKVWTVIVTHCLICFSPLLFFLNLTTIRCTFLNTLVLALHLCSGPLSNGTIDLYLYLTLKMEVVCSSETSYRTPQYHNPEEYSMYLDRPGN
jgi:hypothetical protein